MDLNLTKNPASETIESSQIDRDYLKTMNLKLKSGAQSKKVTDTRTQFDKMIEGMISPKGSGSVANFSSVAGMKHVMTGTDSSFRLKMSATDNVSPSLRNSNVDGSVANGRILRTVESANYYP